jgi:hypothetical protein
LGQILSGDNDMDMGIDHGGLAPPPELSALPPAPTTPTLSTRGTKRSRENETPSQRHKREKAAERQRRKRERDRQAVGQGQVIPSPNEAIDMTPNPTQAMLQYPPPLTDDLGPSGPQFPPPMPMEDMGNPNPDFSPPISANRVSSDSNLTPEEVARRERVRAAARERQRKHRALVKQKKMRELGYDMGNELQTPVEEPQYANMYHPASPFPPPPQHHDAPPPHVHPPVPVMQESVPPPPIVQLEPPLPIAPGQPVGGQTFASTLLLSFSCTPILKQHLLHTLKMTNEELASLQPIIAHAWDQWDHHRHMGYAKHGPDGVVYDSNGAGASVPSTDDGIAEALERELANAESPMPPRLPPVIDPELEAEDSRSSSADSKDRVKAEGAVAA